MPILSCSHCPQISGLPGFLASVKGAGEAGFRISVALKPSLSYLFQSGTVSTDKHTQQNKSELKDHPILASICEIPVGVILKHYCRSLLVIVVIVKTPLNYCGPSPSCITNSLSASS